PTDEGATPGRFGARHEPPAVDRGLDPERRRAGGAERRVARAAGQPGPEQRALECAVVDPRGQVAGRVAGEAGDREAVIRTRPGREDREGELRRSAPGPERFDRFPRE